LGQATAKGGFSLIEQVNANNNLIDISMIKVDKKLPQSERCKDFNRQIKDIALYKCGGFHYPRQIRKQRCPY